jgi:diamine N-acetyltransferase
MNIVKIEPEQAEDLADLCQRIYKESYTYLWDDAGEWYQQTRYNSAKLLSEIEQPNVAYFFVSKSHALPIGYLKLNLHSDVVAANVKSYGDSLTKMYDESLPVAMAEGGGLEVERIYFLKQVTGQGLGVKTMDFAFEWARQQQKNYVWLHVMDSAPARKFYEKYGFEVCGETALPFEQMKPEYRRMLKMWKQV